MFAGRPTSDTERIIQEFDEISGVRAYEQNKVMNKTVAVVSVIVAFAAIAAISIFTLVQVNKTHKVTTSLEQKVNFAMNA